MSDSANHPEDTPIRAVIGLGNPGREYQSTRHNVGFEIVDQLAREAGASWKKERKWQAEVARCGAVMLVKPQTFMNLSGQAAAAVSGFFKLEPAQILAVYDDADLPLGTLRFRMSGSAGGHNGIKSMIQSLGSDGFPRLKFGIGQRLPAADDEPAAGAANERRGSMVGHVLGRFAAEEREEYEKSLAIAVDAVNCALARGLAAAMNQFNQKPNKPGKTKRQKPQTENPSNPDPSAPESAPEATPNPES